MRPFAYQRATDASAAVAALAAAATDNNALTESKIQPLAGCAALEGINRMHAVLGISEQCIATYPGDFAQALIALDATVEITGRSGVRTIPFSELHKPPGNSPQIETTLAAGELVSGFSIPGR